MEDVENNARARTGFPATAIRKTRQKHSVRSSNGEWLAETIAVDTTSKPLPSYSDDHHVMQMKNFSRYRVGLPKISTHCHLTNNTALRRARNCSSNGIAFHQDAELVKRWSDSWGRGNSTYSKLSVTGAVSTRSQPFCKISTSQFL